MADAISFDDLCYDLAEKSGKAENLIRAEIEGISAQMQITLLGATAVWINRNSADLAKGPYIVKILRKSPLREFTRSDGTDGAAIDLEILYLDETGTTEFNSTTVWDDVAKELDEELVEGSVYEWNALINNRNQFRSISDVAETVEAEPTFANADGMTVNQLSKARSTLEERDRGMSGITVGWIGSVITPQGGDAIIGFRLTDIKTAERVTVWFSGEYSRMTPETQESVRLWLREGLQVGVYGFYPKEGELRTNAVSIWRMEE